MDFTRGDHRGDATVHIAVDPAELILAGRPVAADGMNVAVDEPWYQGRAFGVDGDGGSGRVDVFLFADGSNTIADSDYGVGVEDGIGEVSAEQEADVAEDQLGLNC